MDLIEIKGKINTAICYARVVEDEAIEQIRRMCDYPMTEGSRIRIMPDVHSGKGYVAAINEEPVVPEYDYTEVVATITSLDEKIAIIKHALNVTNSNEKVQVGDAEMSIDTILIKMAQLNKRKSVLDQMRKQLPKAREEQRSYMSRNTVPEYRYINYDLELIKKEYEAVSKTIMEMQMALDKYNQTVQFEVDI